MGDGIKRIKIIISGYKNQIAKLDGDGARKHQRTVPENKDPEQIGQCPKQQVKYGFIFLQDAIITKVTMVSL
jgi:hypothetical protein